MGILSLFGAFVAGIVITERRYEEEEISSFRTACHVVLLIAVGLIALKECFYMFQG